MGTKPDTKPEQAPSPAPESDEDPHVVTYADDGEDFVNKPVEEAPAPEPEPSSDDDEDGDEDDADDMEFDDDGDEDDGDGEGKGLEDFLAGDDDEDGDEDDADDEDDEDGDEDDADDEEEEPKKKRKRKVTVQERINKLTKEKGIAQSENEALRRTNQELMARLDRIEKSLTKGGDDDTPDDDAPDPDAPDPSKFTYGEADPEYVKALVKHAASTAVKQVREEGEEARRKEADAQRAQELSEKYVARLDAGKSKYKDFDNVVAAANNGLYPLTKETAELILDSEVGHDVLYDIGKNLKLAKELAAMSPTEQARAFGRLEARHLSNSKKRERKKTTSAPPPPKKQARGTTSRTKFDPKTASFEDLEKRFNEKGRI